MESLVKCLRDAQALAHLIGKSPVFLKAIELLPAIAKSDATALITGETGTGKELVARAIHYLSPRAGFPFVPVNCGSLPDTLVEDALFGHERGAFTDARTQSSGLIAQAEKGTLFLDEVEALTPKAQVVLLRFLQERRFRAVGATREQQADVRIVAATNAPLDQMVQGGDFRNDTFYRLCVFSIDLPALRDRRDDIMPLTHHFLQKHAPTDTSQLQLTSEACEALLAYDWPGNVRELENAIIRGIHLSKTKEITLADLGIPAISGSVPLTIPGTTPDLGPFQEMKRKAIEAFERSYLTHLMRVYHGNVSHAAAAAGKERRDLGKLLKRYQIDPKRFYLSFPGICWMMLALRLGEPFLLCG